MSEEAAVCGERADTRGFFRCNKPAGHTGDRHTANIPGGSYTWGYVPEVHRMSTVEIDHENIWELHGSRPGAKLDDEWGGWRLEQETRLDDDDWYSHWAMVVSREDKFLVRHYYCGRFRDGLIDSVRANTSWPATLTFTEVYPVPKLVPAHTVTEYLTDDELLEN